jgi:hypothetical protein
MDIDAFFGDVASIATPAPPAPTLRAAVRDAIAEALWQHVSAHIPPETAVRCL